MSPASDELRSGAAATALSQMSRTMPDLSTRPGVEVIQISKPMNRSFLLLLLGVAVGCGIAFVFLKPRSEMLPQEAKRSKPPSPLPSALKTNQLSAAKTRTGSVRFSAPPPLAASKQKPSIPDVFAFFNGFNRNEWSRNIGFRMDILNDSKQLVQDVKVRIAWKSATGTIIGTDEVMVYVTAVPGATVTFWSNEIIDPPANYATTLCTVLDAVMKPHDPDPGIARREQERKFQAAEAEAKRAGLAAKSIAYERGLMEKGDGLGYYLIGRRHLKGDGLEKDEAKAHDLLKTAAAKGNSDAASLLRTFP